jgi:multiple antibiotic resistance protein
MLRAQRTRASETKEEVAAGAEKDDIAVTPLAVPMLAGPGAISSVLLLQGKAALLGAADEGTWFVVVTGVFPIALGGVSLLRWSRL